jgi:hypothetical protein
MVKPPYTVHFTAGGSWRLRVSLKSAICTFPPNGEFAREILDADDVKKDGCIEVNFSNISLFIS